MEMLIVSGMSGAGKSKVASILEDIGFYVVDNIPTPLIPKFAEFCMSNPSRYQKIALVTDIRGGEVFDGLFEALKTLEELSCAYQILYVEATTETIIKRYKETRRSHPMCSETRSLSDAIRQEREALNPVRSRAKYIIDTTVLTTAKLRGELLQIFIQDEPKKSMTINVMSFGFKHGIPIDADLVFDVRFLPNPFYIEELRHQTGLQDSVYNFVFGYQQTKDFMTHLEDMISFLLPSYVEEGKNMLVVAIGCTGGHHRSVAITKTLTEFIQRKGYRVIENHRDITR